MPKLYSSYNDAKAQAIKTSVPMLVLYDIPGYVIQDNIRKLANLGKLVCLQIKEGNADEARILRKYNLDYLEGALCDSHGNVLKNHLLDCGQMAEAANNSAKLGAQFAEKVKTHLAAAQMHIAKKDFVQASQALTLFVDAEGSADLVAGAKLLEQVNTQAAIAYDTLNITLKSKTADERTKLLREFVESWPSAEVVQLAKKVINDKRPEKPFLGHCPVSPKEISYLKYRVMIKSQRYYMCCVGCMASAKKRPQKFVAKLNANKERLRIK